MTQYPVKFYMLGQLFALMEEIGVVDAEEIFRIMCRPGEYFGRCMARAMSSPRYDEIKDAVAELATRLNAPDIMDEDATPASQGQFLLGYYKQKTPKRTGRVPIQNQIAWKSVDFSKTNAELARELGITRQSVRDARKKYAPES